MIDFSSVFGSARRGPGAECQAPTRPVNAKIAPNEEGAEKKEKIRKEAWFSSFFQDVPRAACHTKSSRGDSLSQSRFTRQVKSSPFR
jgi:hypothetical protein